VFVSCQLLSSLWKQVLHSGRLWPNYYMTNSLAYYAPPSATKREKKFLCIHTWPKKVTKLFFSLLVRSKLSAQKIF